MASYGYQSDHVNLIADNLRNRYALGFPILKELIQNADDAKARRQHLTTNDRVTAPVTAPETANTMMEFEPNG